MIKKCLLIILQSGCNKNCEINHLMYQI